MFRRKHLPSRCSITSALRPSSVPAAIVGAGVLGLPYAMSFLGWPGGTVTLALSWVGFGFRDPLHLWVVPLPRPSLLGMHCQLSG